MAFGLGERYMEKGLEEPVREQIDVACECWFTSRGRTMPLMVKFPGEDGNMQVIKNIHVNHTEMKRYAGSSAVEHDCNVQIHGIERRARLIYYMEQGKWVMCL